MTEVATFPRRINHMATEQRASILLHHLNQAEAQIVAEDNDQFLWTVQEVVRACKAQGRFADVGKQLRTLLQKLRDWCNSHPDDIREAYLTVRDSGLLFLLVRKTKPFNEALEEALTDLDLEVANDNDFDLIRLSVLALPATSEESVRSFLPRQPPEVENAL